MVGTTAPSAQANAQNDTDSNCVGSTTTFDPPIALYTYDHLKKNREDLYAGDVELKDFLDNIIHPFADDAYKAYVVKMYIRYKVFAPRFIMEESEYIRLFKRDFIAKSDQEHIGSWKKIVEWTSFSNYFSNKLEPVVLEFVNKATAESIRSPAEGMDVKNRRIFGSSRVNKAVSLHDHLTGKVPGERNLSNIRTQLIENDIKDHGAKVQNYKTTQNKKEEIVALVKLNELTDKITGLGILCNDTMGYKVEVLSYTCLGPKKGEIRYRYTIYDHFGLDKGDVNLTPPSGDKRGHLEGLPRSVGSRQSFLSWFYLQRVKGYKPVVTEIINEYTVSTEYEETKHVK